ncbi:c-type heme family protein [Caulobacter sp. KR2-114]|uniref:Tll0287-like domain-containing protein n=1 Tax=Caulobacter sp. KR2-114 TaxID=3400912 RepID=UPI003C0A14CB
MKLQTKFNLAMLLAFLVGLGLSAAFAYKISLDGARREVLQQAALMTSVGDGASAYTEQEVAPLLTSVGDTRFAPQTIPFLAVQDQFRRVQKAWPDYSYKDAALNPTNPADHAADWEAQIINRFRAEPGLGQTISQRDTADGPVLSVARPIRIKDAGCLQCHSTPDRAPKAMVALYGTGSGFGWKMGETVGAQIVSVPMHVALQQAHRSFLIFLGGLAFVFIVTIVALNVVLNFVIVRPASEIARMATAVSLGQTDVPECPVRGKDEIASLAEAFNRMRRSLANAMKLLGE